MDEHEEKALFDAVAALQQRAHHIKQRFENYRVKTDKRLEQLEAER